MTPGPWYFTASDADGVMVTDRRGAEIALWPPSGGTIENCANGRLLAAAPDLLAALQRITHPMADDTDIEHARTVIAKATGE